MKPTFDVGLNGEYIGTDNWPSPIPIIKNSSGKCYFDTDAGIKEILYRRVDSNENDAIDTLHTLLEAQCEYVSQVRDGGKTKQYALKLWQSVRAALANFISPITL